MCTLLRERDGLELGGKLSLASAGSTRNATGAQQTLGMHCRAAY